MADAYDAADGKHDDAKPMTQKSRKPRDATNCKRPADAQ